MAEAGSDPSRREVHVVADDRGLSVIGEPREVKRVLKELGLWKEARRIDLKRLAPALAVGSDATHAAAQIAANSGRWVKLTKKSAHLKKIYGLMESKVPGEDHLMIGAPGRTRSWLQTEKGALEALLANPVALSNLSVLMAQTAKQQAMADIGDYLRSIDIKLDAALEKIDQVALMNMRGARTQIHSAMTMWEVEGRVSDETWDQVADVTSKLANVEGYVTLELDRLAKKLRQERSVKKLAALADGERENVQKWLGVLAECRRLREAFDIIVLDRAGAAGIEHAQKKRKAIEMDRADRLDAMTEPISELLNQMTVSVERANDRMLWTRAQSFAVIKAGNSITERIDGFSLALGLPVAVEPYEPRRLSGPREVGSRAIQGAKTAAPIAASAAGLAVAGVVTHRGRRA